MIYHFTLPWVVLDHTTGVTVPNRSDGVLLDRNGVQVETTTPYGVPTRISTSPAGTTAAFMAPIPAGRVRFGKVDAPVWADENMDAAERAEAAQAAAQQVLDTVTSIAQNATEVTYFGRTPEGDVYVSPVPIVTGGGRPRVTPSGDVVITFNV